MTTVVTAFYPLTKSKHSIHKYNDWIKNFCKFNCNLVVFTTPEYSTLISTLRPTHNTHIITKDFYSYAMTTPEMMNMWQKHHAYDREAAYHCPELYAVWAIKQECVMLAIKDNHFLSTHFVWCDIGIQRIEHLADLYNTFPSHVDKLCDPERITILEIYNIPHNYYLNWLNNLPINYPLPHNAIAAGCIAGDIKAWEDFSSTYVNLIHELDKKNIFVGKEQDIFLTMLLARKTKLPYKLIMPVKISEISEIEWMSLPVIFGGKAPAIIDTRFEPELKTVGVTFMGGLGNQLFQAAGAYAYAKRQNKRITLPDKSIGGHRINTYYNTFMFNLKKYNKPTIPGVVWNEPTFSYTPIPDNKDILVGYYQSSKYFNDISNEIRILFTPNPIVNTVILQKYSNILSSIHNKVVIHVRRTDYLAGGNATYHAVTTNTYYKNAIALMKEKLQSPEFLVFSDDLEWCKAQEFFAGATFIDEKTDYLALHLMSQFKHYIIPNSSFSWWAAYLGTPAETVIVPDRWFGSRGPQDYQDIYEPSWIKLSCS